MKRSTFRLALLVCAIFLTACDRPPAISDYPPFVDLPFNERVAGVPVILVGRIESYSKVGRPRPSRWGKSNGTSNLTQLNRITVRVENVLQGNVSPGILPIYYFMDFGSAGLLRLGMDGMGGTWQIGDRELFFLQQDTGVLRTICDSYAHCVVPVLSGSHADANPDPGKPITQRIVDLLLTRGKGCTDRDWLKAVEKGSDRARRFDMEYTIKKLQVLSASEMPGVRKQSCDVLAILGKPCAAASRE